MKYLATSLLLAGVVFAAATAQAIYLDFDATVPTAVSGTDWSIVPSGEQARGNVLACSTAGGSVTFDSQVTANGVISFLARNAAASEATLSFGDYGAVTLPASSGWTRHVLSLPSSIRNTSISVTMTLQSNGTPSVSIDNFYVGRQLKTSTADVSDVFSFLDAADGLLATPDGGCQQGSLRESGWKWMWGAAFVQGADGLHADTGYVQMQEGAWCGFVVPLEKGKGDNIAVQFEMKKSNRSDSGKVVPILSTNNWESFIPLGEFIPANTTDFAETNGWLSILVQDEVSGLKGNENIMLGFQVESRGYSGEPLVIRNLSVTFLTRAEPVSVGLSTNDVAVVEALSFDDDGSIGVVMKPTDDAANVTVSVTHERSGSTKTLAGTVSQGNGFWKSAKTVSDEWGTAFEAGETNVWTVSISYDSSIGLETMSPETLCVTNVVGGLGTVWMNEIVPSSGCVELVAPIGRTIRGWSIETSDGSVIKKNIANAFDVANCVREVVAICVVSNCSFNRITAPVDILLKNSAGIVENRIHLDSFSSSAAYAATNTLPWLDGDVDSGVWTGAADGFQDWIEIQAANTTLGALNESTGQGVELPSRLSVLVRSKNRNTVSATLSVQFSGEKNAQTHTVVISDANPFQETPEEGVTNLWYRSDELVFEPFVGNEKLTELPLDRVVASAAAFGYASSASFNAERLALDREGSEEVSTNVIDFILEPSVGYEDFSSDFRKGSWNVADARYARWLYATENDGSFARAEVGFTQMGDGVSLSTISPMTATFNGESRRNVKYAIRIKNTCNGYYSDRLNAVLLDASDGGSHVVDFLPLSNKNAGYALNTWIPVTQWAPLPSEYEAGYKFSISAVSGGYSGKNIDLDDLYLSFQDYVGVDSMVLTPAVPEAGKLIGVDVSGAAGAGGAKNVEVRLYAVLNGTTNSAAVVTCDSLDDGQAWSYSTNDVLGAVGFDNSNFVNKDEFLTWVEVSYDTRNGALQPEFQRDVTYFPDNSTVDPATGIRSVTGEYAPVPMGGTAWGVQKVWINEVNPNAGAGNCYIEFAGRTNETVSLTGWSVEITDFSAGTSTTVAIPAGWSWGNVTNDVGFYVLDGLTLPAAGGIKVFDNEGVTRYAYCYDAGSTSAQRAGYANLGAANGQSLSAYREGNTMNHGFEIPFASEEATKGYKNANQSLDNAGPADTILEVIEKTASSVTLRARATEYDEPVSFQFKNGNTVVAGWATNETCVVSGLSQNTEYTFTVHTKDALETSGASATTNVYTLLDSFEVAAAGTATDAIKLTATVAGLGNGQTAWWVDGMGATITSNTASYQDSSWTPNSSHTFTVNARNGDGVSCTNPVTASAYTLAAVPGAALAVSNESNVVRLSLAEGADYANGNPDGTKYAVKTTLWKKGQSASQTSYWFADEGQPAWHSLAEWPGIFEAHGWADDITPTNIVFQLVARNGDGTITKEAGPAAETHFELSVEPIGTAVQQYANGLVELSALITNPWTNDTAVALEYSTDGGSSFAPATVAGTSAAYGEADLGAVDTYESGTNTVTVLWNALRDLGNVDVSDVSFRWTASTENSAPKTSTHPQTCDVYLAQPSITGVTACAPALTNANPLLFTVLFSEPVSNLAASAFSVQNGTVIIAPVNAVGGLATTFTVKVTPAADGAVTLTAIAASSAQDDFGNQSQPWSGDVGYTYDGTKPAVSFTSTPAKITNLTTGAFTATASDATQAQGLTLSWKLDNGSWTALAKKTSGFSWTFDANNLSAGEHAVSIKAKDAAGNESDVASYTWFVDTTAPTVRFTSTPAKITNVTTAAFTASADDAKKADGLTLSWKLDNGSWTALAKKTSGFSWTFNANNLPAGEHTVSIKAKDAAGNESDVASYTWFVDTTAPTVRFASTPAKITNVTTGAFTASADDAKKADGLTLSWKLDNGSWTALAKKTSGFSWTFNANNLGVGEHTVSIKAKDAAGNESDVASYTWFVDTTAPTVSFASTPAIITNVTMAAFTASADDAKKADGLTLSWKLDNGSWTALAKKTSGFSWTFNANNLGAGEHIVSIKAKDAAGNESDVASYTWVVDTTAPGLTLTGAVLPEQTTGEGDFAIALEASDANGDKGFAFAWKVMCGGACVAEGSAPAGTASPYTARGSGLGNGTYTITATATDAAGNATEAMGTWTVDQERVTCRITPPAALVKGNNATFTITFSKPVTGFVVGDIVADNCTLSNFSGSGTTYTVKATATSGATTIGISVPAHVCEDAQGNGNEAGALVTCAVDNTAPAIANLSATPARAKTGASVTVSFDVTEANAVDTVKVKCDVAPKTASKNATKGAVTGINTRYGATVAASSGALVITATDKAGNSTTKSFSNWVVIDDAAPVVTWNGVTDGVTNTSSSVVLTLGSVTDADPNVSLAWSLDGGAVTGADWAVVGKVVALNNLADGPHTFAWTATDTAGNEGTGSISWTVENPAEDNGIVVDGENDGDAAVFTVTVDGDAADLGEGSYFVDYANCEAGDVTCDGGTVTVSPANVASNATVTLIVPAGALGNQTEASATVVLDNPPAPSAVKLEFVGRALKDAHVLEWTISGVNGKPAKNTFVVAPAGEAADESVIIVTDVVGEASPYTIQAYEKNIPDVGVATHENFNLEDWFTRYQLVYTSGSTCVTNVGVPEANLAMTRYGGTVGLQDAGKSSEAYALDRVNDGIFQNVRMEEKFDSSYVHEESYAKNHISQWVPPSSTNEPYEGHSALLTRQNVIELQPFGGQAGVFRSVQWMNEAEDIESDKFWRGNKVFIEVGSYEDGTWMQSYSAVYSWEGANYNHVVADDEVVVGEEELNYNDGQNPPNPVKPRGSVFKIPVPNAVGTTVRFKFNNSSQDGNLGIKSVDGSWWNVKYWVPLVEVAAMGAPTSLYEKAATTVTAPAGVLTPYDADDGIVFHVDFGAEFPTNANAVIDLGKAYFVSADGTITNGAASFAVENRTKTGCDLRMTGVADDPGTSGKLVLDDGFVSQGGVELTSAAESAVVDFAVPTLEFASPESGTVSTNGLLSFSFHVNEPVTGVSASALSFVTTGCVVAEVSSMDFDAETLTYTVAARATQWIGGSTIALRFAGDIVDLAGNTSAIDVTSAAVTLADPTTAGVPTVTVSAGEGGMVSPAGKVAAPAGSLSVTATPNAGYTFARWTGATPASGTTTATFTGLADGAAIAAEFTKEDTFTVTVNTGSNGTASWATAQVAKGGTTSVTFTANLGYYVKQVKEGGTVKATTSNYPTTYTYSIDNVTSAKTITGVFEALPAYAVSVTERWLDESGVETNSASRLAATVAYDTDWSTNFTAAAGYLVDSVAVDGVTNAAAHLASTYTLKLRGVIADRRVVVTYATAGAQEEPEPPEPSGFTMTDLSWTKLDLSAGTLDFVATMEGDAPATLVFVYRATLKGEDIEQECEVSFSAGGGTVELPSSLGESFFAIGFKTAD